MSTSDYLNIGLLFLNSLTKYWMHVVKLVLNVAPLLVKMRKFSLFYLFSVYGAINLRALKIISIPDPFGVDFELRLDRLMSDGFLRNNWSIR